MTSNIEKQFYETFEIKPKEIRWCENDNKICDCQYDCDENCSNRKIMLPQITDRIYLELIRIHFGTRIYDNIGYRENLDKLKEFVLKELTESYKNDFYDFREEVKEKVQALFKEE